MLFKAILTLPLFSGSVIIFILSINTIYTFKYSCYCSHCQSTYTHTHTHIYRYVEIILDFHIMCYRVYFSIGNIHHMRENKHRVEFNSFKMSIVSSLSMFEGWWWDALTREKSNGFFVLNMIITILLENLF